MRNYDCNEVRIYKDNKLHDCDGFEVQTRAAVGDHVARALDELGGRDDGQGVVAVVRELVEQRLLERRVAQAAEVALAVGEQRLLERRVGVVVVVVVVLVERRLLERARPPRSSRSWRP